MRKLDAKQSTMTGHFICLPYQNFRGMSVSFPTFDEEFAYKKGGYNFNFKCKKYKHMMLFQFYPMKA